MSIIPKKEKALFRYLLFLNYLFIVLLLLAYASNYINPEYFWFISLFGMAYPFILFLNIIFILAWLILKKKYFLYSLFTILIGINLAGKYIQFNSHGSGDTGKSISLLSYNVHNFSLGNKSGIFDKRTQQEIFAFIESENADIVCMQEFNYIGENVYASHAQLKQRLGSDNYYFESYFNPKKNKVFGLATFSKFPIINKGIFDMPETRKFGTYIDIVEESDTLRIYNIHLESLSLNYEDYSFVTGFSSGDSIQSPNTTMLLHKLHKAMANRIIQLNILKAHIEASPYPVIVCGDFNELPCSYLYTKMSSGLGDAFVKEGKGIGKTFAGKFPAFRIDYILFNPVFTCSEYNEFNISLSDHFPIKAKLNFK